MDIGEGREGTLRRQDVHDGVEQFTLTFVPEQRPRQAADDGVGLTEAALGEDGGDVTRIRRDRVEAGEAFGQQGGEPLVDVEGHMPPPPVESLLNRPAERTGAGTKFHDDRLPH